MGEKCVIKHLKCSVRLYQKLLLFDALYTYTTHCWEFLWFEFQLDLVQLPMR